MKAYIFFFTKHGGETALKINEALLQEGVESRIFTTVRQVEKNKLFETSPHGFSVLAAEAFSQKNVVDCSRCGRYCRASRGSVSQTKGFGLTGSRGG